MVCVSAVIGRARLDIGNIIRSNLDQQTSVLTWTNGLAYELRVHAGRVQMLVPIFFFLEPVSKMSHPSLSQPARCCKVLVAFRTVSSTKIVAGECYQVTGTIFTVL